jgi:hypothetical protein
MPTRYSKHSQQPGCHGNLAPVMNFVRVMAIASFACALSSSFTASAQPANPAPSYTPAPTLSAEELATRKAWRSKMLKTPAPKSGCFHLAYPNTEWQEIPCRTAPDIPYPMKARIVVTDVGGGNDFVAQVAGSISTAIGLFDARTNINETGPGGANDFALQLNTNQFDTDRCTPPATTPPTPQSPSCKAWQQFIFSNFNNGGFIQYWLIGFFDNRAACSTSVDAEHGGCCPSGWNTFKPTAAVPGAAGCYRNSPMTAPATPFITLTPSALTFLNLVGRVSAGSDSVLVATDTQNFYTGNGLGDILGLTNHWTGAEFNIVGDGNSHQATFSGDTTIDVRIDVEGEASCAMPATGLTAETNSLNIVPSNSGPCCTWKSTNDREGGIAFTQSNVANARSFCEGKTCVPAGQACSATGTPCCAQFGQHVCSFGRCVPVVPPATCNGVRRPTEACSLGWHCCDRDGWVCGQCQ